MEGTVEGLVQYDRGPKIRFLERSKSIHIRQSPSTEHPGPPLQFLPHLLPNLHNNKILIHQQILHNRSPHQRILSHQNWRLRHIPLILIHSIFITYYEMEVIVESILLHKESVYVHLYGEEGATLEALGWG